MEIECACACVYERKKEREREGKLSGKVDSARAESALSTAMFIAGKVHEMRCSVGEKERMRLRFVGKERRESEEREWGKRTRKRKRRKRKKNKEHCSALLLYSHPFPLIALLTPLSHSLRRARHLITATDLILFSLEEEAIQKRQEKTFLHATEQ